ncbi:hypothetical protein [Vibrio vulnificus]|uniref:hypothetical protein n=1 Tax=Vibrio vulnificus TaxID=672 RepID=UPI00307F7D26
MELSEGQELYPIPDVRRWDGEKAQLHRKTEGGWIVITDNNFSGEMTEEEIKEDYFVKCFGCEKSIPYQPPYPPEQSLCDECSDEVGDMIRKDEL